MVSFLNPEPPYKTLPTSPDAMFLCKNVHIWFLHTLQTYLLLTSFDTNIGNYLSHPIYIMLSNDSIPLHICSLSLEYTILYCKKKTPASSTFLRATFSESHLWPLSLDLGCLYHIFILEFLHHSTVAMITLQYNYLVAFWLLCAVAICIKSAWNFSWHIMDI